MFEDDFPFPKVGYVGSLEVIDWVYRDCYYVSGSFGPTYFKGPSWWGKKNVTSSRSFFGELDKIPAVYCVGG